MNRHRGSGKKWRIPSLKWQYRILLYIVTVLFAAFSIVQAESAALPYIIGIGVYVIAAVSLFSSCVYVGTDIKLFVRWLNRKINLLTGKNKLTKRLSEDYRLRTVIFTAGGLSINIAFAVFNGVIGFMSRSPWYITLAFYYLLFSIMRFWAINYERRVSKMEQTQALCLKEINVYKNCSFLLILTTAVLGGMVILTVHSLGGKHYPGVTIYAIALYTFIKVPMAMISRVKTGKMKSPLLITIRNIGYADACVSVLSLQTAMFASFGEGADGFSSRMNKITGAVVCLMVLAMGVYGTCSAHGMKKQMETEGKGYDPDTGSGR